MTHYLKVELHSLSRAQRSLVVRLVGHGIVFQDAVEIASRFPLAVPA